MTKANYPLRLLLTYSLAGKVELLNASNINFGFNNLLYILLHFRQQIVAGLFLDFINANPVA
ncbi:hypothetical protein GCM10028808_10320 [Spirosoma migulaei]